MNAQRIIGQISDKIFHSDFNILGSAFDPVDKFSLEISDLISSSIKNDVPPALISNEALDKPMLEVVNRFKEDDYEFVEMIARAKLTGEARDSLADHVEETESLNKGTMLLATVEGEYHRHGKDIISSLVRGIGFDTIDLGFGISTSEIFDSVNEHQPDYLGISAYTRTTIPELQEMVDNIQASKAAEKTTVILGGFLAIDNEADAIDADYRCSNIQQSIDLLLNLAYSSN
ncbi:MAG: cobalamin-dependent protein [Desulfobacterales bacterium]|jgi:5-methyltetrahydrofolate--homocysteine methyltransferase